MIGLPAGGIGRYERVEANLIEFKPQEHGYLGIPELLNPKDFDDHLDEMAPPAKKKAKGKHDIPDYVDEEDDEDEGETSASPAD